MLCVCPACSATSSPAVLAITERRSNYQRAQSTMQFYNYQGDNGVQKSQYAGKTPACLAGDHVTTGNRRHPPPPPEQYCSETTISFRAAFLTRLLRDPQPVRILFSPSCQIVHREQGGSKNVEWWGGPRIGLENTIKDVTAHRSSLTVFLTRPPTARPQPCSIWTHSRSAKY